MAGSTPLMGPVQLQQPPPVEMARQAYDGRSAHGSVGPVIGVFAVVVILGAMAVIIGRLCSGRGIRGRGRYDFQGWIESKCGTCIDGRVHMPPPLPPPRVVMEHSVSSASGEGAGRAAAPEDHGSLRQQEQRS